jgi:hypothetical protein
VNSNIYPISLSKLEIKVGLITHSCSLKAHTSMDVAMMTGMTTELLNRKPLMEQCCRSSMATVLRTS